MISRNRGQHKAYQDSLKNYSVKALLEDCSQKGDGRFCDSVKGIFIHIKHKLYTFILVDEIPTSHLKNFPHKTCLHLTLIYLNLVTTDYDYTLHLNIRIKI